MIFAIATALAIGFAYVEVKEDMSYMKGPNRRACLGLCSARRTGMYPVDLEMCIATCMERMKVGVE